MTHKKKKHIGGFFWDYNEPWRFHKFENKDNYKDIRFSDQTYKMKTNSIGHLGKEGIRNNFKLASYIINDEPERKLLLFAKSIDSSIYSFYPEAIYEKELEKILNPIIIGSQLNLNNLKLELKHVPEYPVPVPMFLKDFVETMGEDQGTRTLEVRSKKFNVASESYNVTLKSQSKKMYLIMKDTGGELYIKNVTDADYLGLGNIFDSTRVHNEKEIESRERKNLQEFMSGIALHSSNGSDLAHDMFDKSSIAQKMGWDLDTFRKNNESESHALSKRSVSATGGIV